MSGQIAETVDRLTYLGLNGGGGDGNGASARACVRTARRCGRYAPGLGGRRPSSPGRTNPRIREGKGGSGEHDPREGRLYARGAGPARSRATARGEESAALGVVRGEAAGTGLGE